MSMTIDPDQSQMMYNKGRFNRLFTSFRTVLYRIDVFHIQQFIGFRFVREEQARIKMGIRKGNVSGRAGKIKNGPVK